MKLKGESGFIKAVCKADVGSFVSSGTSFTFLFVAPRSAVDFGSDNCLCSVLIVPLLLVRIWNCLIYSKDPKYTPYCLLQGDHRVATPLAFWAWEGLRCAVALTSNVDSTWQSSGVQKGHA